MGNVIFLCVWLCQTIQKAKEGVVIQHILMVRVVVRSGVAVIAGKVQQHHIVKALAEQLLKFLFDLLHILHTLVAAAYGVQRGKH